MFIHIMMAKLLGIQLLAPSSWHGVTTVVMGNCGVGFAPVNLRIEIF